MLAVSRRQALGLGGLYVGLILAFWAVLGLLAGGPLW